MEVTLHKGLKVGGKEYKTAVIIELTNGDIIAANREAESLEMVPDLNEAGQIIGYHPEYVKSPTMVGVHTLRRQISIGPFEAPLEMKTLNMLDPVDMNLIQNAANNMDIASIKAAEALGSRGRNDGDSGAPAKAD